MGNRKPVKSNEGEKQREMLASVSRVIGASGQTRCAAATLATHWPLAAFNKCNVGIFFVCCRRIHKSGSYRKEDGFLLSAQNHSLNGLSHLHAIIA